jgi:hypothetical protein
MISSILVGFSRNFSTAMPGVADVAGSRRGPTLISAPFSFLKLQSTKQGLLLSCKIPFSLHRKTWLPRQPGMHRYAGHVTEAVHLSGYQSGSK